MYVHIIIFHLKYVNTVLMYTKYEYLKVVLKNGRMLDVGRISRDFLKSAMVCLYYRWNFAEYE